MNFFVSDITKSTALSHQSSPYSLVVMLVVFCLIFYFMVLRPQKKQANLHKKLMNSITRGDEVLTTGGLVGHVIKVTDNDYIFIALNDINEVIIKRDFIVAVLPKGTIKSL
ncbi:preprotein translocase, YajC subunit [secondary endosymbiont of Heteropsylla cubana]|uniref:Sec translocon accessory complex subunit YajC n=1 Tax=secondary endosymbiont of Heteropsylla cubana TaxID=134287 RepID=J3Z611_9ENTR|nr:preprotein translocase subunit YajC [secondary endosymbiont of Heteropsylla cubana]AFP85809.1 preprotein translocase, YajC subunit [secondary endosymbiont of Heteropsylla cubana]